MTPLKVTRRGTTVSDAAAVGLLLFCCASAGTPAVAREKARYIPRVSDRAKEMVAFLSSFFPKVATIVLFTFLLLFLILFGSVLSSRPAAFLDRWHSPTEQSACRMQIRARGAKSKKQSNGCSLWCV
jgi:hypothetical protein